MSLEISQNSQEYTCARVSFLIKGQASGFIKKEILAEVFSCEFCEIFKNSYSYRTPPVAASECSRSLEYEKRTDQNFIMQNLRHGKEYCISKKKKLFKQSQKEVIYEYILAFAGWWSIFWNVVGSGGYISAGGGWWWIYFGWWCVVVVCFGCWLVVVGRGGSWHSLA